MGVYDAWEKCFIIRANVEVVDYQFTLVIWKSNLVLPEEYDSPCSIEENRSSASVEDDLKYDYRVLVLMIDDLMTMDQRFSYKNLN